MRTDVWHPAFKQHLCDDVVAALHAVIIAEPCPGWSYHQPREDLPKYNYTVTRPVDMMGPSDLSSAVDWRMGHDVVQEVSARLFEAYDSPTDSRIGSHNVAEIFGSTDGVTVVGRVHGRYSGGNVVRFVDTVHLALNRQWAGNPYVFRSVLSVVTGESHKDWLRREHPRIGRRKK